MASSSPEWLAAAERHLLETVESKNVAVCSSYALPARRGILAICSL